MFVSLGSNQLGLFCCLLSQILVEGMRVFLHGVELCQGLVVFMGASQCQAFFNAARQFFPDQVSLFVLFTPALSTDVMPDNDFFTAGKTGGDKRFSTLVAELPAGVVGRVASWTDAGCQVDCHRGRRRGHAFP